MLTLKSLKRFAPNAREDYLAALLDGEELLARAEVTEPLRIAHRLGTSASAAVGFEGHLGIVDDVLGNVGVA